MNNEGIIQGSSNVIHADTRSPFVKFDLVVQAQQTPGVVLFNNYEQLKASIGNGVSYYSQFEYSLENYQIALKHHNELKHVKSVLEKTKREVVKNYNAPLEIVEKRIDELIDLIKIPYKKSIRLLNKTKRIQRNMKYIALQKKSPRQKDCRNIWKTYSEARLFLMKNGLIRHVPEQAGRLRFLKSWTMPQKI